MRTATLKDLAAQVRAIVSSPASYSDSAIRDLIQRETDAVAWKSILNMGIHGEEAVAAWAEQCLRAGASPEVVADAIDECWRRYGEEITS